MDAFRAEAVRAGYDSVAERYTAAFAADLKRLPVDRAVLDSAVSQFTRQAPVLDVGCGPAQVGRYLSERGVSVVGIDLASKMLAIARRSARDLALACGDLQRLPIRSGSCAGVVAFYSLHHLTRSALGGTLRELRRVLLPAGALVVATHLGNGEVYAQEFLGQTIRTIGGTLYDERELRDLLSEQSFIVDAVWRRQPIPHEHQTERIYLIARRDGP